MSLFADHVVPNLLGMELNRRRPAYVGDIAIQPTVVHEFGRGSGDTVELNRQAFIGTTSMTKAAREVTEAQRIGQPANTPSIKSLVRLVLKEYIGPVDAEGQGAPLTVGLKTMQYGRRNLWEKGLMAFHASIGSETLADDYQRFYDRAMLINELTNTTVFRNPGGVADGATTIASKVSSADTLRITETLTNFNVARFDDGFWHCLCDPRYLTHLQEDTNISGDYRAVLTGMAYNGRETSSIQMMGATAAVATPSGVPLFLPPQPFVYNGVAYWASTLISNKTVNSLTARTAYYFGPGTVLLGSGGPEGAVNVRMHESTDYNRIFAYIWQAFMASVNPIPAAGDPTAGAVIESRTFAV
jgi:hypothetical protein